jgi:hypothetical protein
MGYPNQALVTVLFEYDVVLVPIHFLSKKVPAPYNQVPGTGTCFDSPCRMVISYLYTRPVGRAVDPDSLNPDTDPAFQVNLDPIQIQGFDDQKLKKKIQQTIFFFF